MKWLDIRGGVSNKLNSINFIALNYYLKIKY